jgi:hypothetical protein
VRRPRFTEDELREAVAAADSWAMTLRLLGMRVAGGNHGTVKKWAATWGISSDHFDPAVVRARVRRIGKRPLEDILVEDSTYARGNLKRRLYEEGLKQRRCELCGQGEIWHGKQMSLILDHIDGNATDNRLENLRIACPNCAATFETHCGRNANHKYPRRDCRHCGTTFWPKYSQHHYCSHPCGRHSPALSYAQMERRRVERPPYEQLTQEIAETNYSAVGRKHGVSDNAIRKWVRAYERELAGAS